MQPQLTCIFTVLILHKKALYRALHTLLYASLHHVLKPLILSMKYKNLAI